MGGASISHDLYVCTCDPFSLDIAELAEKNQNMLVPDEGCQYDQLIEIDLSKVTVSKKFE